MEDKVGKWVGDRGLYSVFQPIYSFSNQACVGYEVLIRGINTEDQVVPVYECLQAPSEISRTNYMRMMNQMHLQTWKSFGHQECWLFINIDFEDISNINEICLQGLLKEMNIKGCQVVIEVVESEIPDEDIFNQVIDAFRSIGCLIALDDFGAGHSNVDRIWKAQPDIVKLDRNVLLEATKSLRSESILRNLTRLIQQSGSICLLEGIETREQALLAMDVGVDLVQGFYFARPNPDLSKSKAGQDEIQSITSSFKEYMAEKNFLKRIQKRGYEALYETLYPVDDLNEVLVKMEAMASMSFVKRFFVLDEHGFQISDEPDIKRTVERVNILKKGKGLCWKNRRYFIKAMRNRSDIFVSQPYRSLIDMDLCLTVSKVIELASGEILVACFDVFYHDKAIETVQISV